MLTQERLKEVLSYNKDTGEFKRRKIKKKTGTINGQGRRQISIDRVIYSEHRLAWLYINGYFPENEIDHIDRDPLNNKINNLREVTRSCNARNCGMCSTNTSGVKGVGWFKLTKKYVSRIWNKKRSRVLGYSDNFDEAVCLRLAAEQCLDWAGCDKNSPAFLYIKNNINFDVK